MGERDLKAMPAEWQPLFIEWAARHSLPLRRWKQYGGAEVLALTFRKPGAEPGARLLLAVPHAHEPAGTAALVKTAAELVRSGVGDGLLVTIMPDNNPQGRSRSPRRFWTGGVDTETVIRTAFGIGRDGERFPRLSEWRFSEHSPLRTGIEFEQIDPDLWVEPNTSRLSTHTRAVDDLFAQFRYTHMLELHQHQYEEAVLLPADYDDLPEADRDALDAWAEAVLLAWERDGFEPLRPPRVPYKGQPRQKMLRDFSAGRCPGMKRLTIEVLNNRHARTDRPSPAARQVAAALAAVRATLDLLAGGDRQPG